MSWRQGMSQQPSNPAVDGRLVGDRSRERQAVGFSVP
jgi:hypothetical protein